ncbi:MAG: hypothetical protein COY39_00765 [Alphaproteobacteria bacterium CG_4_10_14_0_8_um_filter_37_21]|nr:MAG: hypothetical protein COY39_00765 [Alphaproteobacteria bacterium CG_4_10_14_0_8_um_filter_37_21]
MTNDDELWNALKSTIKPIKKKSRVTSQSKPVKVPHPSESTILSQIIFQQSSYKPHLSTQKEDTSNFKKKQIQARIDLHGMTCAQAEQKLQHFFAKASCLGNKTVLVITGKGQAPEGGVTYNDDYALGTLRNFTMQWFHSNPQWVVSYAQASNKEGGLGAFYVHVRRQK